MVSHSSDGRLSLDPALPRRPKRLLTATVVIAAVIAFVLAGCGSAGLQSAGSDQIAGVAVDRTSLRGPGTPLGDGLAVPEETWLVAAPFPMRAEWTEGTRVQVIEGWLAVLLVEGPPVKVWNDLVRAAGMTDAALADGACTVWREVEQDPDGSEPYVSPQRALGGAAGPTDYRLHCSASEGAWSIAMTAGVAPNCVGDVQGREFPEVRCGELAQRHLTIRRTTSEVAAVPGSYGASGSPPGSAPAGAVNLPPMPEDRDDAMTWLPAEGELVDARMDSFLWTGAVVAGRARSVVAPAMIADCNSGLIAVMESPLPPRAALGSVAMRDHPDKPAVVDGTDSGGRKWASHLLAAPGGYYLTVTALEKSAGADEGSWVLASECGD